MDLPDDVAIALNDKLGDSGTWTNGPKKSFVFIDEENRVHLSEAIILGGKGQEYFMHIEKPKKPEAKHGHVFNDLIYYHYPETIWRKFKVLWKIVRFIFRF